MVDRQVRVVVSAVDKGAGKSLTEIGDKGEKAGHRLTDGFAKVGQLIGGEVGNAIQEASDKLEHFGKGNRIGAVGAAAAGLGGILAVMGSKEQAATQQLDVAIKNSGHNVEDYGKRIEETVGHMEHYGHSAVETKNALATITNATHDPAKALGLMAEAADLAAAKHESLQSASEQLAKVIGGHGAKTLAAYNIAVVKNADGTTNWTATNEKLAGVLKGQASAAANTFSGRLKALRTEVEDNVAAFGQKYGPAIMIAGTAMTTLQPVAKGLGTALGKVKGSLTETGDAASGTKGRLGALGLAAVGVTVAVSAGMYAWNEFHKQAKVNAQAEADLTAAIQADNGALGENTRVRTVNNLEKEGALKVANKYGISLALLTSASMGDAAAQAQLITQVKGLSAAHKISAGDALKLNIAMVGLTSTTMNSDAAARRLREATAAGGKSIDVMAGSAHYTAGTLSELAHKGQLTAVQLDALVKAKRVNVNGAAAIATLKSVRSYLDSIQDKTVTVGVTTFHSDGSGGSVAGSGRKFNAGGTDFFSGGLTSINEREPEIVSLPRGSKITPASRMRGGSNGDTNINVTVNVPIGTNMRDAGRALAGALEQYATSGGKIRIAHAVN